VPYFLGKKILYIILIAVLIICLFETIIGDWETFSAVEESEGNLEKK
jgi:hypothetical protein